MRGSVPSGWMLLYSTCRQLHPTWQTRCIVLSRRPAWREALHIGHDYIGTEHILSVPQISGW
jgi:hypothetical protein